MKSSKTITEKQFDFISVQGIRIVTYCDKKGFGITKFIVEHFSFVTTSLVISVSIHSFQSFLTIFMNLATVKFHINV